MAACWPPPSSRLADSRYGAPYGGVRKMLHRLLIALWSVALSFVVLALIGTTNLLSHLVGAAHIQLTVEIAFFVLSGLFAVFLWRFMPLPRRPLAKILALLIPLAIFVFLLT